MGSLDVDARLESLLRTAADRAASPLRPRHRRVDLLSALAMSAAVAALAAWLPAGREDSWLTFALLLALLTLASRVRFTVGAFTGAPTQPFLVAAFLLLPPAAAVAIWIAADVLVRLPDYLRRRTHPDHLLLHARARSATPGPRSGRRSSSACSTRASRRSTPGGSSRSRSPPRSRSRPSPSRRVPGSRTASRPGSACARPRSRSPSTARSRRSAS